MSSLIPFWYIIIAVLWTGFFVLEGFDFGVGMLHAVIATVDLLLMLKYSRQPLPPARAEADADTPVPAVQY